MKLILCVFFGLMAGMSAVWGQTPATGGGFPGWQLRADSLFRRMMPGRMVPGTGHIMSGTNGLMPIIPGQLMTMPGRASVRVMKPDGMSCIVAYRRLVERMPVSRMESSDPMPNGVRMFESEAPPVEVQP